MKGEGAAAPPPSAPLLTSHVFFSGSLLVRSAQRHPAAGATLHLQELVVLLRKPVW